MIKDGPGWDRQIDRYIDRQKERMGDTHKENKEKKERKEKSEWMRETRVGQTKRERQIIGQKEKEREIIILHPTPSPRPYIRW